MIDVALAALELAGYEVGLLRHLTWADLPGGYRAMNLADGAVLGSEAFSSQAMLNHVLEEELLHQKQKLRDPDRRFAPGTARALEEEVDEQRRFKFPRD